MFHTRRLRLLFLMAFLLFSGYLAVSVVNYRLMRDSVRDELAGTSLSLLRDNIYSEILKSLVPPMNISSSMANDAFLINWITGGERDETVIRQYLENIRVSYGFDSAFFVSARTGHYYHHNGILKTLSPQDPHDVWFYRFVESGLVSELDVDTDEADGGTLTIFVNYRIADFQGNLLGVTGVGLKMTGFSRFLEEKQKRYDRVIYLTDEKGIIQAHSRLDLIENVSLHDLPGHSRVVESLLSRDSGPVFAEFSSGNSVVMVTSLYMPEIRWFLIVEQEGSRSLEVLRGNLLWMIGVGLLIALVTVVVSVLTLNSYRNRLERAARTDELTKVANRYELDSFYERMVHVWHRHRHPFSLIILDVDRFKQINDTWGHLTGDKVLVRLAEILSGGIRSEDLLARYGGDEFVMILNCGGSEAIRTAQRLRSAVEDEDFSAQHRELKRVTISLGLSEFQEGDTLEQLVMRADRALYVSKEGGRNRLSLGHEAGPP